jgi:N-carbamoyl-L-amino-acid hydrolase
VIPAIDEARLIRELETLAGITTEEGAAADAETAITRVVFTEPDLRARDYVKTLCALEGLVIREDAVGNTFARWQGWRPELAPVATGSHIDAIPNAGKYDGTVGVLGGLEAIRALRAAGIQPARSIELIIFTSEEPTRFRIGCLGSRLLAGALDDSAGARLTDRDGRTLDEVRAAAGFSGPLSSVRLPNGAYAAFVELHIEQGPLLEQRHIDLGVVTALAAPAGLEIMIEGEGGHAGAVLMPDRRDAFLAAAEIALAVEAAAKATGAIDTVATVGVCDIFPGAVNSVPSAARLEVDVRDIDEARRDGVLDAIAAACEEIAARRRVRIQRMLLNADPPALCAHDVVDVLANACDSRGWTHERMISRAYHDSLFMSRVAPTAMLFIPCRDGVSHRPDEYASPDAIARGTTVLADALANLSAQST